MGLSGPSGTWLGEPLREDPLWPQGLSAMCHSFWDPKVRKSFLSSNQSSREFSLKKTPLKQPKSRKASKLDSTKQDEQSFVTHLSPSTRQGNLRNPYPHFQNVWSHSKIKCSERGERLERERETESAIIRGRRNIWENYTTG